MTFFLFMIFQILLSIGLQLMLLLLTRSFVVYKQGFRRRTKLLFRLVILSVFWQHQQNTDILLVLFDPSGVVFVSWSFLGCNFIDRWSFCMPHIASRQHCRFISGFIVSRYSHEAIIRGIIYDVSFNHGQRRWMNFDDGFRSVFHKWSGDILDVTQHFDSSSTGRGRFQTHDFPLGSPRSFLPTW